MCILKMLYNIFDIGNNNKFAPLVNFKQPSLLKGSNNNETVVHAMVELIENLLQK